MTASLSKLVWAIAIFPGKRKEIYFNFTHFPTKYLLFEHCARPSLAIGPMSVKTITSLVITTVATATTAVTTMSTMAMTITGTG